MKKTIFVLPLCLLFAFCSSSRKAATPAGPGISNVNVSRADTMTSAATAAASFTPADRDWAYTATRDTSLNGTWTLDGMQDATGNWSSTQTWYQDNTATDTTTVNVGMDSTMNPTETTTGTNKKSKAKRKNSRNELYDTANARLGLEYKTTSAIDTSALAPYAYWKRIPTVNFNATKLVFTGNTGCNSMSGSFNFNDKDIQFGRNIITTRMACNEYDETAFLSALKKADNYTLNGNTLELKQGNTLLLTFRKV